MSSLLPKILETRINVFISNSHLNDLFEIELIFYGLSRKLQFFEFVWTLSYSVWDVFNNFLRTDATDTSKISSDRKRFLSHLAYTPFHFSWTLPLTTLVLQFTCILLFIFRLVWSTPNILQETSVHLKILSAQIIEL